MNNDDLTMKVLGKLDDLTLEIKALRSDASDNKRDINLLSLDMRINNRTIKAMQTDLSDLKSDVRILKEDVDGLKENVRRLEVLHEETDESIKEILEIAGPSAKQIITLKKHNEIQDEKLQFHERHIGFLEKKVA